jgi:hypothetical protein
LRHLFVVQPSDTINIVPLNEKDALLALLSHWYLARFGTGVVRQLQAQAAHFMQCVALAQGVCVSRLERPLALAALPRVAEAIWDYVATSKPDRSRAASPAGLAAYARPGEVEQR